MDWRFIQADSRLAGELAAELDISPLLASLLIRRGAADSGAATDFLYPSLKNLPDPFSMHDMNKAVDRLIRAMDEGEAITVYGDYDADGLTATALLHEFLNSLGATVSTYVPHRLEEGYGLSIPAVERLAASGTRLIVTVDCGISDFEAVSRAVELGIEVIITDHHQMPPVLPPAVAVLNPQKQQCGFPQRRLAGVGVAFFLAGGLRQALRERSGGESSNLPALAPLLSYVTIGTVADVVPLCHINRILVRAGLEQLKTTRFPGLVALKAAGDLQAGGDVTVRDIAFRLAPRLNATGRLTSPQPGLDLLLAKDILQARSLADALEKSNHERRRLQSETIQEAADMLDQTDHARRSSIFLVKSGWQRGVVGLAAAKLTEMHQKPAILLAVENGLARGSGRSIPGFNLFAALTRCREYMVKFGGHELAAGLTVEVDKVPDLIEAFEEIASRQVCGVNLDPRLDIDAVIRLDELGAGLAGELNRLAPFGEGNPEPLLAALDLNVVSAGTVGAAGSHLKLRLSQNGRTMDFMGFGLGLRLTEIGRRLDIAIQPYPSTYQGRTQTDWKIVDFKKSPAVAGA